MFILKCMTICTLCIEDSVFIIYKVQPSLIKKYNINRKRCHKFAKGEGCMDRLGWRKRKGKPHNYLKNDKKKYFNSFYIIALSDFSKMRMNRL